MIDLPVLQRRPRITPLLEREPELAQITGALERANEGQGVLLVVEAAAGLGKTSLLDAAVESARAQGMAALRARGSPLEREFAYGVVRQALEPALTATPVDERDSLFAGAAGLARPLLGTAAEAPLTTVGDPSYATLHGLYWLLFNLSCRAPLTLIVDDAHWADTPSLRFLCFVAARLDDLPVALTMAWRTSDPGAERAELGMLACRPDAVAVRPRPLSPAAVAALLESAMGAAPDSDFVAACHEATAGNPFFLHRLLSELVSLGIDPDAGQAARVRRLGPRAVSRAVLVRLSGLDPEAPAFARALAVLGDGATLAEVVALAGLRERGAARLADLLVQAAVIKRSRALEFVHPIVREAIYRDLPPRERAAAHARAARSLASAAATPERVAAQLLETEPAGASCAVEQLRAAARQASATGAFEGAVRYLRRALAEPPEAPLRPEVLLELGTAGIAAGQADGQQALEQALHTASAVEVQVGAAIELGTAMLYGGRPADAVGIIERTLERLGPADDKHRRALELLLLMHAHSTTTARRLVADRLQRASKAVEADDPAPEVLATVALDGAQGTGTADQAARLAAAALASPHLLGASAESAGFYFATCALTLADRGDVAEAYFDRALEIARRAGSARGFASTSCCRGWTRYRRGNLLGAEADLRGGLELALEFATVLYPLALGALIKAQLDRGDHDGASDSVHSAAIAGCDPESQLFQEFRGARARWHLAEGRPAAALEDALAIGAWADSWKLRSDPWTRWRSLVAQAHAALGDTARACAVAQEAVERAREFGAADHLGVALRTAASVATHVRAIEHLEEAVSVLERSQARLERAAAHVELGAALRRANRRSDARAPLRDGLQLARDCDATTLVERATAELHATGARPRQMMVTGVEALTPSERRVATMAAGGLSSPQIAQALFVSLKTVETHLGHVYAKLGIHSRTELRGALERTS